MLSFTGVIVFVIASITGVRSTDCPDGWTAFEGSCYLIGYGHQVSFTEAEHFCRQHHESHLIEVNSRDENEFIKKTLTHTSAGLSWLGCTDEMIEGVWRWFSSDTAVQFTDWDQGQPDGNTGQDCAIFHQPYSYTWHDDGCNTLHTPICEITEDMSPIVG